MGKLLQGIDGPFVGKVGPTVGYLWKNRPCVRAYQQYVHYPNTAKQQRERDWFVSMVRFASQARQSLLLGVSRQAEMDSMTEGNYFVNRNKQHFVRSSDGVEVDYARLVIAIGPAADVVFHSPVFREHEAVSIDFDKNTLFSRASGDDKVYVFAYSHEVHRGMLMQPVERRTKNVTFRLPEEWSGSTVHLYGFVVDREGRPSNSTYIGAGRLSQYSEGGNYITLNKSWLDFVKVANSVNATEVTDCTEEVFCADGHSTSEEHTAPPGDYLVPE